MKTLCFSSIRILLSLFYVICSLNVAQADLKLRIRFHLSLLGTSISPGLEYNYFEINKYSNVLTTRSCITFMKQTETRTIGGHSFL